MSIILYNDTIEDMFKLINETPDDTELGKKIRQYYKEYVKGIEEQRKNKEQQ